ncbi:MucR family transcriptional regulator [Aureimonas sp. Leaf454]|uniref:MucR family transcriptional regulator n=1 Tax=Aureimonas sp. Leaf454 TaxID=1736381 RepID=UPI0006F7B368|nr:MucR family transcriptional regulator [Aureimonas sp. Leaf454]KQT51016.1 MucR family transcriptional regulator [Aureimonas sp. Leaf454]
MTSEEKPAVVPIDETAHIVAAYVSNNRVAPADLPDLIASVFAALTSTSAAAQAPAEPEPLVPAVSIKKSVSDDYLICLEDGKKFKSLKRHLMTHYNLTPDEYRAKWKLPADYPMVAPNYAAARSALAKSMGLGRKPADANVAVEVAPKARTSRKMKEAAE